MRLKRLELFGFKSFADRTVMDFGRTTLTGIVGPNGCGKSNVVDAVRWVLGETRPTSMRGSGMTDVIFKGSASRPAMGTAEVTIVLDNTKPGTGENGIETEYVLDDRGPEVAISRRLYASGEGEYLVDGVRVRLKDVKDLLFDTGLGSRGYSVLEQGRIDAVLSANPTQRRAIFEEAAGISRYRQRRHEAELRLKRCEQDVERLEDVMGELRSRVRSLKIQAGKAEKYVVAKAEWTVGRTRFLSHRLVTQARSLEQLRPAIDELEVGVEGLRERRGECEVAIEAHESERAEVVEALGRIGDEASGISGDLRALEERKSQLAMRIASWAASAEEEVERAGALEAQLEEREAEHARLLEDVDSLRERTTVAEERARGLSAQGREMATTYKELRQQVQAQNDKVLARLHERTAAENKLVHLGEALTPTRARLERSTEQLASATEQVGGVRAEQAKAAETLALHTVAVGSAVEALSATRSALEGARSELEAARKERAARELERTAQTTRMEALLDRDRELEDLSGGGRKVLEMADTDGGPCTSEELHGLVADHLKADLRLARAIDAVLGDRAHALVARDAHVARRIVDWCEAERVGQVGVVVPPGIGAPDCPPPSDYALFARFGAGVEGRLGDLVQCEPEMKALVHALFCDVVVVSSLDIALDLVGREPGWRFVTPRGELVDAAGLVGGHREVAQGFVGRRSSAAELERRIAVLATALRDDDLRIAAVAERLSSLEEEEQQCNVAVELARGLVAEAESARSAAVARLADLESALENRAEELEAARAEVTRVEKELAQAQEDRARASEAFDVENERLEQIERGRRQLETEREDLQKEEGRAQVELSAATAECSGLEQRIEGLARLITETGTEIERSRSRAGTYAKSADEGRIEVAGIAEQAAGLETSRAELDAKIEGLRESERSGAQRISETRKSAEAVQVELDAAAETLGKSRLDAQAAELAQQEIVGRAMEELELEERDLRESFQASEEELLTKDELKALEKEVNTTKGQLDRLGPVNLEAVHELEEVGGRLDHLEAQSGDLADARRTLMDTIRTIDEESRRLFVETFEEVRGNFQRIFRLLFGGGKADVRLTEGEDVLDAGVEIVARPPGRELLAIGLLSGGQRTMTALALLFAVFEARPSPFCVLDEVDAALDDANIDRFLGMLDGFRESTQFIVVTHNKGTMAASQALYGVTMQVKGVSRFVTVELDEVDEFAPETIGSSRPREARVGSGDSASEPGAEAPGGEALSGEPEFDESGEPIKVLQAQSPANAGDTGAGTLHESAEQPG